MHSANPAVVHLDLNSENVLVRSIHSCVLFFRHLKLSPVEDHTLQVFIADFGLGRVMTMTRMFGTATKLAGTPGFQSPEQLRGDDVTCSADIYALGAILTKLFGGKPIWGNLSSYAIMCKVSVKGAMPKIDHSPLSIKKIVNMCLCEAEV